MAELLFSLGIILGQASILVWLLNRFLMNMDADWRRSFLIIFSIFAFLIFPVLGLALLQKEGILFELAHFRGSPAADWFFILYFAAAFLVLCRFLWISLVSLPHRNRPSIVAETERKAPRYPRPDKRGNPIRSLIARINRRFDLEINRYILEIPGLPESFDGFSIVHLTDIHASDSDPPDWLEFVSATVMDLRPDLIALTGDFLAGRRDLPLIETFLSGLQAPKGIFAVRGNHDFWESPEELREVFRRTGVELLDNKVAEIHNDSDFFEMVGIESPWDHSDSWRSLFPRPRGRVTVVLSHTPDNAPLVERLGGATLMLVGHTHGGQIRLPLVGSLLVPSRYGKRFDQGWFALGRTVLYVNRGIGAYAPRLRIACAPEAALLVFRVAGFRRAV